MATDEVGDDIYAELFERGKALLHRNGVEGFNIGPFLIEGSRNGGLFIFYRDEYEDGQNRGPRVVFRADKDGKILFRARGSGDLANKALAAVREHMVLDDLSEIE